MLIHLYITFNGSLASVSVYVVFLCVQHKIWDKSVADTLRLQASSFTVNPRIRAMIQVFKLFQRPVSENAWLRAVRSTRTEVHGLDLTDDYRSLSRARNAIAKSMLGLLQSGQVGKKRECKQERTQVIMQ